MWRPRNHIICYLQARESRKLVMAYESERPESEIPRTRSADIWGKEKVGVSVGAGKSNLPLLHSCVWIYVWIIFWFLLPFSMAIAKFRQLIQITSIEFIYIIWIFIFNFILKLFFFFSPVLFVELYFQFLDVFNIRKFHKILCVQIKYLA